VKGATKMTNAARMLALAHEARTVPAGDFVRGTLDDCEASLRQLQDARERLARFKAQIPRPLRERSTFAAALSPGECK
jgi:hypothetical protein